MAIKPPNMTPEEFEKHRAAAKAETEKNAAYDADPRAAFFALEERVRELEGKGKGKGK